MSNPWSDGYFTDVGYTFGYYRDINPIHMAFCLLINGFEQPELGEDSVHCELGFGQGVSVAIHSAGNAGNFYGTDFTPAHASHAKDMVSGVGSNAHFFDHSFAEMLARNDLPLFDTISLHGIWTWVSRENQQLIVDFAKKQLKPGGCLYISYNCFPGWSPTYPLRQLFSLHDQFLGKNMPFAQRVDSALKFSEELLNSDPAYLTSVPVVKNKLKTIMNQNKNYVAHEYFNAEWNSMYFTDVANAMAASKLDFACTSNPQDLIDSINLSDKAREFLGKIDNRIFREQIRDYFLNQQFRKDIYVRGARKMSASKLREKIMAHRFVLMRHESEIPDKVQTPMGDAQLQPAVYKPLIAGLVCDQYRPKTLEDILNDDPSSGFAQVAQAITLLVGSGMVAPCQSAAAARSVAHKTKALNAKIMQRARHTAEVETLASPETGGGVPLGRFNQIFLSEAQAGNTDPVACARVVWGILESQNQRLIKDGNTLQSADENLKELTVQAQSFFQKTHPILLALGV